MIYLFIGYVVVGLYTLLSMPLDQHLNTTQIAMVVAVSMILDFILVIPYYAGRRLSKTKPLHPVSLLIIGGIVGLFDNALLNLGVISPDSAFTSWIPATLFLLAAFIPQQIEIWRSKTA